MERHSDLKLNDKETGNASLQNKFIAKSIHGIGDTTEI